MLTLFAILAVSVFSASIKSPDGRFELTVGTNQRGEPIYSLDYNKRTVIKSSRLGFVLKGGEDMFSGFELKTSKIKNRDRSWNPIWGEVKTIRDYHRELETVFEQSKKEKNRKITILFRLFNDGLGFRYEFPEQDHLKYLKPNSASRGITRHFGFPGTSTRTSIHTPKRN
jgi:hypothetical protein